MNETSLNENTKPDRENPDWHNSSVDDKTASNSSESNPDTKALDAEPQFGLLDVVEAFTAMRHQWRTQSKENRSLAQSIEGSTALLTRIESTLDQKLLATTSDGELRKFIALVIELDISLTRAVEATSEAVVEAEDTKLLAAIGRSYEQSGFFSRLFGRKIYQKIVDEIQTKSRSQPDSTLEGVRLLLSRLRRAMSEQNLTRVETVGKTFDGETMKAISSIDSDEASAGVVVQEITPAYFYNGQLVRVAEVRVAK